MKPQQVAESLTEMLGSVGLRFEARGGEVSARVPRDIAMRLEGVMAALTEQERQQMLGGVKLDVDMGRGTQAARVVVINAASVGEADLKAFETNKRGGATAVQLAIGGDVQEVQDFLKTGTYSKNRGSQQLMTSGAQTGHRDPAAPLDLAAIAEGFMPGGKPLIVPKEFTPSGATFGGSPPEIDGSQRAK